MWTLKISKLPLMATLDLQKTLTRLENFLSRVSPAEGKIRCSLRLASYPKGTYKMEGKDAVSNILLTHDDDNLLLKLTVKISTLYL